MAFFKKSKRNKNAYEKWEFQHWPPETNFYTLFDRLPVIMLSQSRTHDHPRDTNGGRQIVGGIGLCNFHPAIVEYRGVVAKHDDTHSAPTTIRVSIDVTHLHNFPISRLAIWFGTLCLHNSFRWFDGWLWLLSNFHFDFVSLQCLKSRPWRNECELTQ